MNALLRLGYGAAGRLASWLARVAPPGEGKLARSLGARRGVVERFERWAREHRRAETPSPGGQRVLSRHEQTETRSARSPGNGSYPGRPLVWMHAPSVGEGLQARPVLELLRARRPDVQLLYTFFSPSAESFARSLAVDYADYLPFDASTDIARVLDAVRPEAIVFSKLDLWPTLCALAAGRGVRLGLVSGAVSVGSSRRGGVARALLRDAYGRLDAAGAVSTDDLEGLVSLGARREAITVTGDTRYDQVWERAQRGQRAGDVVARLASPRPTLVAGSTWPLDERVLLAAWAAVRREVAGVRLVIAPHEPTPAHLAPIEAWAAADRLSLARLDAPDAPSADVVLVDRVGVLGDLYALATAAFVGGGFHAAGLHSVLEPAAFGAPVIFGPAYADSRDAVALLEADGAASVRDVHDAEDVLSRLLGIPAAARTAGDQARAVVERGLGAAERSFALVEGLLGSPTA